MTSVSKSRRSRKWELLANLQDHREEITDELQAAKSYGPYFVERMYSESFHVYKLQSATREIVGLLRKLAPAGCVFNPLFEEIVTPGIGTVMFEMSHNQNWIAHTRPFVDAWLHALFFLEMAEICARELKTLPGNPLPSCWAAMTTLFCLW